jgi:hypothetical protein
MTDEKLRTLLEQLHEELERTQSVDEKGQELLRDLNTDIRGLLDRTGEDGSRADASVVQRLQSAIDHLEVTHPTLTMALSEIMTVLSNAGI